MLCIAAPAPACDLCAVYRATEARASKEGWYAGAFEQFTRFGTLRENGKKVDNPTGQYMNSSITQFLVGYQVNEKFGLQLNIPYIRRTFKRPTGVAGTPAPTESGTESGLGDIALTGSFQGYHYRTEKSTLIWTLLGGIKFPTGNADRLKEEGLESHDLSEEDPAAPHSGIHGHDLALGSGSFDGIIGTSIYARYGRIFTTSALHLTVRNKGAHEYRYADEWMFAVKPGAYLWLSDEGTLGLQLAAIGETKGKDTFQGEVAQDTGISQITLGPEAAFTWHENLSAELGVDFPVVQNNTSLQIVGDYRIRAAASWRF
jgi:hypothetical protein